MTNRNTCHDTAKARFKEWCLPTNYDLPTLFEGELTQELNLPHLTDMNYVKTYIDAHLRDQKLDGVLNEDKSCTKCDSSGIVYDKRGNDTYCKDCGGLKMVLPGIKMIKMIQISLFEYSNRLLLFIISLELIKLNFNINDFKCCRKVSILNLVLSIENLGTKLNQSFR